MSFLQARHTSNHVLSSLFEYMLKYVLFKQSLISPHDCSIFSQWQYRRMYIPIKSPASLRSEFCLATLICYNPRALGQQKLAGIWGILNNLATQDIHNHTHGRELSISQKKSFRRITTKHRETEENGRHECPGRAAFHIVCVVYIPPSPPLFIQMSSDVARRPSCRYSPGSGWGLPTNWKRVSSSVDTDFDFCAAAHSAVQLGRNSISDILWHFAAHLCHFMSGFILWPPTHTLCADVVKSIASSSNYNAKLVQLSWHVLPPAHRQPVVAT